MEANLHGSTAPAATQQKEVLCGDGVSQARVSDLCGSKIKLFVDQKGQHPGLGGT